MVYSIALRIVGAVATAEEIVQEVFVRFWRNSDKYDPAIGPLAPWLVRVARNRALDHVRSIAERQRQLEDVLGDPIAPSIHENAESAFDKLHRIDLIRAALPSLPPGERVAIELVYFEELTHTQLAAKLNVPLGTAKSWIRTGLLRLRDATRPQPVQENTRPIRPAYLPARSLLNAVTEP